MLSSLNPRHCETVNDLSGAKLWSNPLNTDRSLNIRFLAGPREDGSGAKGISIHIKGKLTLTNLSLQNTDTRVPLGLYSQLCQTKQANPSSSVYIRRFINHNLVTPKQSALYFNHRLLQYLFRRVRGSSRGSGGDGDRGGGGGRHAEERPGLGLRRGLRLGQQWGKKLAGPFKR